MENREIDDSTQFLNEIGSFVVQDGGIGADHLWLYSESGRAWVEIALFIVSENRLVWIDSSEELSDAFMDYWDSLAPDKRWEAMVFEIQGRKFDAQFFFPGELPPIDSADRRQQLIERRFGNRKVIYPPFPTF